jgi:hypothetical protein
MGITKYYVCHWPVSNVEESYYDSHTSEFTTLEETFNKAFKSAGVAGLNVEATTELKVATTNQKKKNNNTLAGVTTPANNLNTTTNVVPSCPPPTITSFSPLTGVSGTILTIVGNNLDEVTGITINNVTTTTGITILNAFNISVVVPFSNNGLTNIQQTPIIVRGIHGSTVTSGLFTYNPSQVTPIPNNTNNTNTQPQQTGPVTLIENTQIGVNGSTSSLMVGVNPQVLNKNTWTLDQTVEMVVSVYDNNVVNNLKTKTLNRTVTIPIIGYVSKNVFNITHENLQVILVSYPIEEFKVSPITPTQTAQIKFTIVAAPTDRAINIQDVTQSFNFDFRPTQTTIPTFAEVAASIVLIGESPTLQGNGPQFFNIKKPDNNGYITFQFNTPSFQEQNYVEIYFLDSDGDKASSSRLVDTQTRYTYEYTLTGKGVFKLIVKYRPYGLKSPVNGQVLTQTVVGPPFTL